MFDDYATLVLPGALGVSRDLVDEGAPDSALLALLQAQAAPQPWWLGYLDAPLDLMPRLPDPRMTGRPEQQIRGTTCCCSA